MGTARQIADGPEVGEQLELLAQRDVDAGEAAADRRRHRAFQPDVRALNGFGQLFWDVLVVFLEGFGAGGIALPLELDAGGFQNANCGVHDLGADTIAGNQRNFVGRCHMSLVSLVLLVRRPKAKFSGCRLLEPIS